MTTIAYTYKNRGFDKYVFTSLGQNKILKVVDFTPTKIKDLYNLSFGDLLPDGTIDDTAISNNGDIIRIMSTVVDIVKHFTKKFPEFKIGFTGSTIERTKLYERVLKMYYEEFSKDFFITASIKEGDKFIEEKFKPQANKSYHAFFIKRIN